MTPWQKAATFGATAKLLGTADGKLVPPATELETSGIKAIALGCLSVPDKAEFTPPVGQLMLGGLPTKLYPVVGTPFTQLQVVQEGSSPLVKPIDEALVLCGVAFRPWGVAPAAAARFRTGHCRTGRAWRISTHYGMSSYSTKNYSNILNRIEYWPQKILNRTR